MTTYVFQKNNEYLVDFDVAGIPVTTSDVNKALWLSPNIDDDWDGYAIPANDNGFIAINLSDIED